MKRLQQTWSNHMLHCCYNPEEEQISTCIWKYTVPVTEASPCLENQKVPFTQGILQEGKQGKWEGIVVQVYMFLERWEEKFTHDGFQFHPSWSLRFVHINQVRLRFSWQMCQDLDKTWNIPSSGASFRLRRSRGHELNNRKCCCTDLGLFRKSPIRIASKRPVG